MKVFKKFAIALASLALVGGTTINQPASATDWLSVHSREYGHKRIVGIDHTTQLWWRYRWPDGDGNRAHAKVQLDYWYVKFNKDGDHYSCDWAHEFKGVTYDLYVWQPITGQNFHRQIHLDCSSSTQRGQQIRVLDDPAMPYVVQGVKTRWKVNIHEHWFARQDVWSYMSGVFDL